MLRIDIIAVGSIKESFLQQACLEYLKRNRKYYQIQILEIKEESQPSNPSPQQVLDGIEKESNRILENTRDKSYLIGLTPKGSKVDSTVFAQLIDQIPMKGYSCCTFAIGGSNGLSELFLAQCHLSLSFSDMTFPHQLFRVLLLEQLFRSAKINHHEPYHK